MEIMPKDFLEKIIFLRNEIDKIFREYLQKERAQNILTVDTFNIPVDIYESPDQLILNIELVGLKKEDIKLFIERDLITVKGERPLSISPKYKYLNMERSLGKFSRNIELPVPVDTTRVTANLADGILHIEIPKVPDRRGKKMTVKIT